MSACLVAGGEVDKVNIFIVLAHFTLLLDDRSEVGY